MGEWGCSWKSRRPSDLFLKSSTGVSDQLGLIPTVIKLCCVNKDTLTIVRYLECLLESTQEACCGSLIFSSHSRPLGLGSSRGKCSQQPQHILQTAQGRIMENVVWTWLIHETRVLSWGAIEGKETWVTGIEILLCCMSCCGTECVAVLRIHGREAGHEEAAGTSEW